MAGHEPLRKAIFINAPSEHVFTYLTDASKMIEWMGQSADLDPHPGGIFRVDINGSMIARGEYVEVVPHERVVFTWGWEGDDEGCGPGATTVVITLEQQDGGTLLRLEHRGLPDSMREGHEYNWSYFLGRIAPVAEGKGVK